jgi:hypothetical protein
MITSLTAEVVDLIENKLGGVALLATGIVDLLAGQHLGSAVDVTLVTAGAASLGVHLTGAGSSTAPAPGAPAS